MKNIKKELIDNLGRAFGNIKTREINVQRNQQSGYNIFIAKPTLIEEFVDYTSQSFNDGEIVSDIAGKEFIEFLYSYYYGSRFDTKKLEDRFLPLIAGDKELYTTAINFCLKTHSDFEKESDLNKEIMHEKTKQIFIRLVDAGIESGLLKNIPSEKLITLNVEYKDILNNKLGAKEEFSLSELKNYADRLRWRDSFSALTSYIVYHIDEFSNHFDTVKKFDDWCDENAFILDKDGKKSVMLSSRQVFNHIITLEGQKDDAAQSRIVKSWLSDKNLFNYVYDNLMSYINLVNDFPKLFMEEVNSFPVERKIDILNKKCSYDLDFSRNYNNFFKETLSISLRKHRNSSVENMSEMFNFLLSFKSLINENDTEKKNLFSTLLHSCANHLEDINNKSETPLSKEEFNSKYLIPMLVKNMDIYADFLALGLKDPELMKVARKNLDILSYKPAYKEAIIKVENELKEKTDIYFKENHTRKNTDSGKEYGYSDFLKKYYQLVINNRDYESFSRVELLDSTYTKCIVKSSSGSKDKKSYLDKFPVFFELISVANGLDHMEVLLNQENLTKIKDNIKFNKKNFIQHFAKERAIENILKSLINDKVLFKSLVFNDSKVKSILKDDDKLSKMMSYGEMLSVIDETEVNESLVKPKKKI